jgi:hypothetical protein
MDSTLLDINLDEIEDTPQDLEPGEYEAIISEAEIRENKAGTGMYLSLKWQVTDGPCANRVFYSNLNIVHQNAMAENIAKQSLKKLCNAIGITGNLRHVDTLCDKPMTVTLGKQKNDPSRVEPKKYVALTPQQIKKGEDKIPF